MRDLSMLTCRFFWATNTVIGTLRDCNLLRGHERKYYFRECYVRYASSMLYTANYLQYMNRYPFRNNLFIVLLTNMVDMKSFLWEKKFLNTLEEKKLSKYVVIYDIYKRWWIIIVINYDADDRLVLMSTWWYFKFWKNVYHWVGY